MLMSDESPKNVAQSTMTTVLFGATPSGHDTLVI